MSSFPLREKGCCLLDVLLCLRWHQRSSLLLLSTLRSWGRRCRRPIFPAVFRSCDIRVAVTNPSASCRDFACPAHQPEGCSLASHSEVRQKLLHELVRTDSRSRHGSSSLVVRGVLSLNLIASSAIPVAASGYEAPSVTSEPCGVGFDLIALGPEAVRKDGRRFG